MVARISRAHERHFWVRVEDKLWIERNPDGLQGKFKILGGMKIMGESGTVVAKIEGDRGKGSGELRHRAVSLPFAFATH
jgi:hypothetical protein